MNSEWRIGDAEPAPRAAPGASDRSTSSIHNSELPLPTATLFNDSMNQSLDVLVPPAPLFQRLKADPPRRDC
jgi:hypothetical protein